MRWRIDLAYDGSQFHGWASQTGLRTVQAVLEGHIAQVLRLAEPVTLTVAGRTDAGVHARGQVCHIDLQVPETPADLQRRLNRVLPDDIVIKSVQLAPEGFDARFAATWRRYCYRLIDTDYTLDPLLRGFITQVRHPVDVEVFNEAATRLLGLRDFAPFCKPREGATTIRKLLELQAVRNPAGVVEIKLVADAFCHSMVRSLVGALSAVAGGKRDLAWLEAVMTSTKRHNEVAVMPARGLTLEEVGYPADDELAARVTASRTFRSL